MGHGTVRTGQLYRSAERGLFGGPGREWRVTSLAQRNDGLTYATLAMTNDPSELKTLAMGVLLDRRMFRLVASPPADAPTLSGG